MTQFTVIEQTEPEVAPSADAPGRSGTWECAGARGVIWLAPGGGYVADSPSVIVNGRAAGRATMDEAARRAHGREIVVGPALATVGRKYRIENPLTAAAVYAVDANDPAAELAGEPAESGRAIGLTPWELEAVKVARKNRSLAVMIRDDDAAHLVAVAGKHVGIIRSENGTETGRWLVLDGCRKIALFLA